MKCSEAAGVLQDALMREFSDPATEFPFGDATGRTVAAIKKSIGALRHVGDDPGPNEEVRQLARAIKRILWGTRIGPGHPELYPEELEAQALISKYDGEEWMRIW